MFKFNNRKRMIAITLAGILGVALMSGAGGGGCAPEPSGNTAQKGPGGRTQPPMKVRIVAGWDRGKRKTLAQIHVVFLGPHAELKEYDVSPLHSGTRNYDTTLMHGFQASVEMTQREDGPMWCETYIVYPSSVVVLITHKDARVTDRELTCEIANENID